MADSETVARLAGLLAETQAAHLLEFAATDGYDTEWASWYARRLAAPLAEILGRDFDVEELAADLAHLDIEHRLTAPEASWADYYAAGLAVQE